MPLLSELAKVVNGTVLGDANVEILRISGVDDLRPGDLTFAENKDALAKALNSKASAVIVAPGMELDSKPGIQVNQPRLAFAQLLTYLTPRRHCVPGIDPTAVVGEGFMGEEAEIGPLVFIGNHVTIGRGTIIYAGAWIGDGVSIGENTVIHGNVVIRENCKIGNEVEIQPGAVIGADGFGYVTVSGRHYKIPQVGIVVIEDQVEIGANSTIDRATTGVTLIKKGSKIDNLVHIAHNCEVGESNFICGQAGLAGSSITGDRVTLAGKVGLSGHLKVGDDSIVAGCAKVCGSLPPKSFVSGNPARPTEKFMRVQAASNRLPEMLKEFREMKKTVAELKKEMVRLKENK